MIRKMSIAIPKGYKFQMRHCLYNTNPFLLLFCSDAFFDLSSFVDLSFLGARGSQNGSRWFWIDTEKEKVSDLICRGRRGEGTGPKNLLQGDATDQTSKCQATYRDSKRPIINHKQKRQTPFGDIKQKQK